MAACCLHHPHRFYTIYTVLTSLTQFLYGFHSVSFMSHVDIIMTSVSYTEQHLILQCHGYNIVAPVAWKKRNRKLGADSMKRVAAGAHLPTAWLFEPAKRPDDRADYCLDFLQKTYFYYGFF